ncbi:hypothetical protein [Anaerobranca gottschalkii]|uniref:Uncharacterized protein n=1 Tax=Anaerobranca gottschalkii DSM 13577 TaxID=1120990 RepID=A0A1H9YKS8_9FIRM|nr:hypothetical protein [Anaerobranca gottschalkii]SES69206.1 hypothetical protein SAMN03080614_100374 [Anaerobranca gottschalkii DSM 13577]
MKGFEELLKKIKEEAPNIDLDKLESFDSFMLALNDVLEEYKEKIYKSFLEELQKQKNTTEYTHANKEKREIITSTSKLENNLETNELNEENKFRIKANYQKYRANKDVEYTLYENFTHKRPYGFKLKDYPFIVAATWKDVLIKTCEIFMDLDENKFLSFANYPNMNGKRKKIFSLTHNSMRAPKKIGDKIYIETNLSANSIRDLIIKLLKEYNFEVTDYKVYFRADYTNLNDKKNK